MDRLLEKLLAAFGVSGHESEIREVIKEELKEVNCHLSEDKMGNLIVKVGAGDTKLMFCAHMDQLGLIATYIEDNGFVRVGSIGDFQCSEVVHNYVRFENGTMGKVGAVKDNPEIGDLFVDIGAGTRDEALKKIKEGAVACFIGNFVEIGNRIVGAGLDNRIGCYILLKLIKGAVHADKELHFVFSSQAELGGRGARAAAFSIEPDYCVVVDLETAGDYPEGKGNIKLGNGPVVTVMDKGVILHHEIKDMLESSAEKNNISIQYAISERLSDGGTIHKEKIGIKTGVVSVPCRYNHTISEMVSMGDVDSTIAFLQGLL